MNIYEKLRDLGCRNPVQCAQELQNNGVTKFYNHNYIETTVRRVNAHAIEISYKVWTL